MSSIDEVEGVVFKIPPRSPDLNLIENFFDSITIRLQKEAIQKKSPEKALRNSHFASEAMLNFNTEEIKKLSTVCTKGLGRSNSMPSLLPKDVLGIAGAWRLRDTRGLSRPGRE